MFNPNGAANDGTKQPSAHTRIYSSPFFLFFFKIESAWVEPAICSSRSHSRGSRPLAKGVFIRLRQSVERQGSRRSAAHVIPFFFRFDDRFEKFHYDDDDDAGAYWKKLNSIIKSIRNVFEG